MRLFVILISLFLGCIWHISDAQSIRIKLDNCHLDKETLEKIQNSLNYQLLFYSDIFDKPIDSTFNARIFGSEKSFVKYAKIKADFNPNRNHSIAFYDPDLKEMILHKEIDDFPRIFAHELNHAILHFYCPKVAIWMNEGLSELLEDLVANDTAYYFGLTQLEKISTARNFFLEGASIKHVINANNFYHSSFQFQNYTLSFAIVFYLFHTNKAVLAKIIQSAHTNPNQALLMNYPGGIDLLAIDVKSFFLNFRPTAN